MMTKCCIICSLCSLTMYKSALSFAQVEVVMRHAAALMILGYTGAVASVVFVLTEKKLLKDSSGKNAIIFFLDIWTLS